MLSTSHPETLHTSVRNSQRGQGSQGGEEAKQWEEGLMVLAGRKRGRKTEKGSGEEDSWKWVSWMLRKTGQDSIVRDKQRSQGDPQEWSLKGAELEKLKQAVKTARLWAVTQMKKRKEHWMQNVKDSLWKGARARKETGRCTSWTDSGAPANARAPARGLGSTVPASDSPGMEPRGRQSPAATGETPSHHTLGDPISSQRSPTA